MVPRHESSESPPPTPLLRPAYSQPAEMNSLYRPEELINEDATNYTPSLKQTCQALTKPPKRPQIGPIPINLPRRPFPLSSGTKYFGQFALPNILNAGASKQH